VIGALVRVDVLLNVAGIITATAAAVTSVVAYRRSSAALQLGKSAVRSVRQNESRVTSAKRDERKE